MHVGRSGFLPLAVAGAFVVGALFEGFDSAFGNPLFALIASICAAAVLREKPPRRWLWKAMTLPYLLLAVGWTWAALTSLGAFGAPALVPDLAAPELAAMAGAGLALLIGCLLGTSERSRDRLLDGIAGFGGAIVLIGVTIGGGGAFGFEQPWSTGQAARFAGTLGNANVAATFYGSIAVIALARLLRAFATTRRLPLLWRAVLGMIVALCIAATAATGSRMGFSVAVGACIALAALQARTRLWWNARIAVGAVLVGLILAMLTAIFAEEFMRRSLDIVSGVGVRGELWGHYAEVAAQSPLTGYGLGSFPTVNGQSLGDPVAGAKYVSVNAAHNILIQLVIDAGLPFLIFIAIAVIMIVAPVLALARRGTLPIDALGVGLALVVLLANGLVDIALDVPAIIMLFWLWLGLIWGTNLSVRRDAVEPLASAGKSEHTPETGAP